MVDDRDLVLTLYDDTHKEVAGAFRQMDWAEDEIGRAMIRFPSERDILYHSFSLLVPTHDLMVTDFVHRGHCRELLERVARGEDTRPGTAAEVCSVCCAASQVAPLRSSAAGLYFRMWVQAFPGKQEFGGDRARHHEALEGSLIGALEVEARRRLTVPGRKLGEITCSGYHNGELVQCKYAGS